MNTTEKSRRPSFDQGVIELPAHQTRAFFRVPASEFKGNFSLLRTKKDFVLKVETDVNDEKQPHQHKTR